MSHQQQAIDIIRKAKSGFDELGRGIVVIGLYDVPIFKAQAAVRRETVDLRMLHAVGSYDTTSEAAVLFYDRSTGKNFFRIITFSDLRKFGVND